MIIRTQDVSQERAGIFSEALSKTMCGLTITSRSPCGCIAAKIILQGRQTRTA